MIQLMCLRTARENRATIAIRAANLHPVRQIPRTNVWRAPWCTTSCLVLKVTEVKVVSLGEDISEASNEQATVDSKAKPQYPQRLVSTLTDWSLRTQLIVSKYTLNGVFRPQEGEMPPYPRNLQT